MVKFKNRYLLLEVVPDSILSPVDAEFSEADCHHAIWDTLAEIHGDFGAGAAKQSLSVKVFNENTKIMCVRISRSAEKMLSSALPFVSRIGKYPAIFRTIHLGGSIRSCEKALLKYHRTRMVESLPITKTIHERKTVQSHIKCKGPL